MAFHIVLVEPLIPQNTGNIARLTAATGSVLHLIEPLGFSLEEKQVRRAGLDYWPEVELATYPCWENFLSTRGAARNQLWMLSTKGSGSYYDADFQDGQYLVFGNEVAGLGAEFHEAYSDRMLRIPMSNPKVRSLNLANAAAAVLFEARRKAQL